MNSRFRCSFLTCHCLEHHNEMTTRESFPYNPGLPDTSQKRRKGGRERNREKEARPELTESPEKWNWGSSGGQCRAFEILY